MILQLRLSNSGFRPAMYPSSVVQTGVKSFGWEKRMAHPLPIQSWKLIFPWVLSAVKFGASLLIRNAMLRSSVSTCCLPPVLAPGDGIVCCGATFRHTRRVDFSWPDQDIDPGGRTA